MWIWYNNEVISMVVAKQLWYNDIVLLKVFPKVNDMETIHLGYYNKWSGLC